MSKKPEFGIDINNPIFYHSLSLHLMIYEESEAFFEFKSNIMDMGDQLTMDEKDNDKAVEIFYRMISAIGESRFKEPGHYENFKRLQEEISLSKVDLLKLYRVMFIIVSFMNLPYSSYDILKDHFAEIILDIRAANAAPIVLTTWEEFFTFESELYRVLGKYVLQYYPPNELLVWGLGYYEDEKEEMEIAIEEAGAYPALTCYVHITTKEEVERKKKASMIAGCFTSFDVGHMLQRNGNLITYFDPQTKEAVTLQIFDEVAFPTFREMFTTIGPAAFGYDVKESIDVCVHETEKTFTDVTVNSVRARKVKKLARPILKKEDLETLQHDGKLYAEDQNGQ